MLQLFYLYDSSNFCNGEAVILSGVQTVFQFGSVLFKKILFVQAETKLLLIAELTVTADERHPYRYEAEGLVVIGNVVKNRFFAIADNKMHLLTVFLYIKADSPPMAFGRGVFTKIQLRLV